MRALLVHNPSAGSGRPTGEDLLESLDAAGFSTVYFCTKNGDLDQALAQSTDIVIVAGGDGTVAKVARALPDRKTLMAILPRGTANNIARCLGIHGETEDLIKALRGAPVTRLDVGVVVGPWGTWHFVEGVGWGALAKTIDRDSDPKAGKEERIARGRAAFAKMVAKAKPRRFLVHCDGDEIEEDFIFVEAVNLGMTGPRIMIDPTAKPGDQLLDLVYLTEKGRQEMLDWLERDADEPPPLASRRAKKVTLAWDKGPLRVDDEVCDEPELASNIIVELEPDSLRVCVPEKRG